MKSCNIIRCHKSKIQTGSKDLHPLHWHLALSRILNLVSTRRAPQPLRFILAILWLQVAQGLSGIQPGAIVWLEANENLSQGPKEEKNHLANNATAIGPHANADSTFRKGPLRAPLWEAGHLDVVTLPTRRTGLTAGLLWRYEIFGESFVASFSGAWSRHKAPSSALNLVQMCEMATKSWDICIKKNWNLGWIFFFFTASSSLWDPCRILASSEHRWGCLETSIAGPHQESVFEPLTFARIV